ncbi:MAG TPA: hypothetical protein VF601_09825 [Beijerinckiaceae bacterium]|jgi:hypothetical protein
MSSANVNDRASIERLYPRDAFEADAARNALPKADVLHGVRIASGVSESGEFALQRTSQQAGENDPLGDTLFLAPFPTEAGGALRQTPAYGGAEENPDALAKAADKRPDYDAFVDRIVETARRATFKGPIGRHEPRLKGFHGG